jgi:hypothetical protein
MELLLELIAEYDAVSYFERVGMPDERPCRVWISFDSHPRSDPGFYSWSDNESCGYIRIGRPGLSPDDSRRTTELARLSTNPTRELLALAHELGHHHSHLRGSYVPFLTEHPRETYAEEARAWEIARRLLLTKRFSDWSAFEAQSLESLTSYSSGLGVDAADASRVCVEEAEALGEWSPGGCVG